MNRSISFMIQKLSGIHWADLIYSVCKAFRALLNDVVKLADKLLWRFSRAWKLICRRWSKFFYVTVIFHDVHREWNLQQKGYIFSFLSPEKPSGEKKGYHPTNLAFQFDFWVMLKDFIILKAACAHTRMLTHSLQRQHK